MFGIFKRAPKAPVAQRSREETLHLLCGSFAQIVMPQLRSLGLELGKIDPAGPVAALQVRVYFLSLCQILPRIAGDDFDDLATPLTIWAFDEIYGLMIGFPLARDTLEHFEKGESDLERSFTEARDDIALLADDKNARCQGLTRLLLA